MKLNEDFVIRNHHIFVNPFNIQLFLPYDPLPGKGLGWDHQTKGFSIFGLDMEKEDQYRFSISVGKNYYYV